MDYIKFLRQYVGHSPILTAGTGILVFNSKRQLLLQLRTDYNMWGVPGGAMELGESFEQTAKRELNEETNLVADEFKMLDILSGEETFRIYPNGDKLYDITAIYEVTKFEGVLKEDNNETKELKWFDLDKLPENLTSMTKTIWNKVKHNYINEV